MVRRKRKYHRLVATKGPPGPWPKAAGFLLAAVVGHFAVVLGAPYLFMHKAMGRIETSGAGENRFIFAPRVTESSRDVVRPSPDLVYSVCLYDLSHGPIRVKARPSSAYTSLSAFQLNGDNILSLNDRAAPLGMDFVLARTGQSIKAPKGVVVFYSPTDRGLLLDRRLAPTEADFPDAVRLRRFDVCAPL